MEHLSVRISDDEYLLPVQCVWRLVRSPRSLGAPSQTPWIRGVLAAEGRSIPVVDLASKLGLPELAITAHSCVVVTESNVEGCRLLVGLLVDEVRAVVSLADDAIHPPPNLGSLASLSYLRGFAQVADGLALLLDVDGFLAAEDALALATAMSDGPVVEISGADTVPAPV